jgi:phosphomannomutase
LSSNFKRSLKKYVLTSGRSHWSTLGLTVEFEDWWFNLRLSNTEPLIRLNIEAATPDLLEQKKKELSRLIRA